MDLSLLELFSGSGKISKFFRSKNASAISIDWDTSLNATHHMDIYKAIDNGMIEDIIISNDVNFIWASPDCTTYSIAQHGIHRGRNGEPKTEYAKECDENNKKLFDFLWDMAESYKLSFIVENPHGFFINKEFTANTYKCTIRYGDYGTSYEKKTDLFSNFDIRRYFKDDKHINTTKHLNAIGGKLNRSVIPSKLIEKIYDIARSEVDND
jgi:site-specific DNA-cytosine methylase